MSETVNNEIALSDPEVDALIALVIRGMARGEVSAEQQTLADHGLIMVKGPIMMPMPPGTALVADRLLMSSDAPERERIWRISINSCRSTASYGTSAPPGNAARMAVSMTTPMRVTKLRCVIA